MQGSVSWWDHIHEQWMWQLKCMCVCRVLCEKTVLLLVCILFSVTYAKHQFVWVSVCFAFLTRQSFKLYDYNDERAWVVWLSCPPGAVVEKGESGVGLSSL